MPTRQTKHRITFLSDVELSRQPLYLVYPGDFRRNKITTDLCYRHINLEGFFFLGFVDEIIWICKDSISISWFWSDQQDSTSRFRSVRRPYLTAQNVCLPSRPSSSPRPKNVYLWPPENVGLSLTAASDWLSLVSSADCLYGVRRSIDNFWPRPWITICKSLGPPCIFI